jgi:hypothetical protein
MPEVRISPQLSWNLLWLAFRLISGRAGYSLFQSCRGQPQASFGVSNCGSPLSIFDFGGVMAEAIRRGLHGQNRHRSDEGKRHRPG